MFRSCLCLIALCVLSCSDHAITPSEEAPLMMSEPQPWCYRDRGCSTDTIIISPDHHVIDSCAYLSLNEGRTQLSVDPTDQIRASCVDGFCLIEATHPEEFRGEPIGNIILRVQNFEHRIPVVIVPNLRGSWTDEIHGSFALFQSEDRVTDLRRMNGYVAGRYITLSDEGQFCEGVLTSDDQQILGICTQPNQATDTWVVTRH